MPSALRHPPSPALWPTGTLAVCPAAGVLVPAANSYSLNIGSLPAPDQLQIWAFLEFLHEYSPTAWRLVPDADADICVVDGPVSTLTLHIRNTTLRRGQQHTVLLARPLQMKTFVATMLQLETPRPARLCGRVAPSFF